jgi:flavin-dependent dehydrogenase
MIGLRHRSDATRALPRAARGHMPLSNGDRVAVIGGGPAGSLFAHALLVRAASIGVRLSVDIYDPRTFDQAGPGGCAHCGGIVSESLVQILAANGLELPTQVVQRGIESYVVHMDVGEVRIDGGRAEPRIAALFRGNGPRMGAADPSHSLDGFLLKRAVDAGAATIRRLVTGADSQDGLPVLLHPDGTRSAPYQLLVVASGVNGQLLSRIGQRPRPAVMRTYICELKGDAAEIERRLGSSMHVFLLNLPRLEFAALIPKQEHVTMCLLGDNVDSALVEAFMESPEVRACLPPGVARSVCHCSPLINVRCEAEPFADRVVWIGDAGVTRLYKDGIGAAFRTSKAAAETAVLFGVSAEDFRRHYQPICRRIDADNRIGRAIFAGTSLLKRMRFARRAILNMAADEQRRQGARPMSSALWNLFTGSAPYQSILLGALRPGFIAGFCWSLISANVRSIREGANGKASGSTVS